MIEALRNLFGGGEPEPPHPAMLWEEAQTPLPVIDVASGAVGTLEFHQPIESARFLGRPDHVSVIGQCVSLAYNARGFELEFFNDEFLEIMVHIQPELGEDGEPVTGSATPTLSNGGQLTPAVTPEAIQAALGEPTHRSEDEGEVYVIYENERFANEFTFLNGSLTQWAFSHND